MGEFTTMHDLFVSCVVPPVERARRAAVFARTARRDHGCRKPFLPCETLIPSPSPSPPSGISRDSLHKRRLTGGKQKPWRKKRK